MKLFAPEYYREFKCIADRCTHSCCVGWEIDIDELSLKKYAALDGGYGDAVRGSIVGGNTPHFRLCDGGRCPHLDERGLCRIITEYGEGYLCDICREHPRFYLDTPSAKEVGVGMACEEACRIILGSDNYSSFVEIGEADGATEVKEFDTPPERRKIYSILSDKKTDYSERLSKISETYGVSPSDISDDEWRELIRSLEYLDGKNKERFLAYSSGTAAAPELFAPLERVLAYFVFRHCSSADSGEDFRLSLGVALFLERLVASVADAEKVSDISALVEIARSVSEELEYSEENIEAIKFAFILGSCGFDPG